jgi:hypothetical protein
MPSTLACGGCDTNDGQAGMFEARAVQQHGRVVRRAPRRAVRLERLAFVVGDDGAEADAERAVAGDGEVRPAVEAQLARLGLRAGDEVDQLDVRVGERDAAVRGALARMASRGPR